MWLFAFSFIGVIDSEEATGKGGDFSEGDEKGFVDLPHRGDIDSAKEHHKPSESKHEGGE